MNKYLKIHIKQATVYKKNIYPIKNIIIVLSLVGIIGLLSSCSSTPIVDSRGKSSANIKGDMNRFHDDLFTCKDLVADQTNPLWNVSKIVYNTLRFKVLWLSPKAQTNQDLINNCLEGRGYSVLNK
jgi:hypothetical protein